MQLRAVFFDFVNTIAEFHQLSFEETSRHLHYLLNDAGYHVSYSQFHHHYTSVVKGYINVRKKLYKEVSNLDFIVGTLTRLGMDVKNSNEKLKSIVKDYFIPFKKSLRMFPKTRETLNTLKYDYSLKVGLISNFTSTTAILEFLTHLDLTHFFDIVVVSSGVGVRKPHPLIFETGLKQLDVIPTDSLFVGDDPECDIAGANEIGMISVQVGSPSPPPIDQLEENTELLSESCHPNYKINFLYEIIELINELIV